MRALTRIVSGTPCPPSDERPSGGYTRQTIPGLSDHEKSQDLDPAIDRKSCHDIHFPVLDRTGNRYKISAFRMARGTPATRSREYTIGTRYVTTGGPRPALII